MDFDKMMKERKEHEAVRVTRTDYTAKMACDLTVGDILLVGNEEGEVTYIEYGGYCGRGNRFYADFPLYDLYLKIANGNGEEDRRIMFSQPGCRLFMVIGHNGTDDQEGADVQEGADDQEGADVQEE